MSRFSHLLFAVLVLPILTAQAPAAILFGVNGTNLVTVDPTSPSSVSVIGAHNLSLNPFYLAYNSDTDRLFGFASSSTEQKLVEYNRVTGQGTIVADMGNPSVVGYFESLEYHSGLQTLLTSNGNPSNFTTPNIYQLSPTGAISFLTSNGRDNDAMVYDSVLDKVYVTDPNGVGQLTELNLGTGSNTDIGSFTTFSSGISWAYDSMSQRIYAASRSNNQLYHVATTGGGAPISNNLVGTISGDTITGLAFAPAASAVPEPATMSIWLFLFLTGTAIAFRRRKSLVSS